MSVMDSIEEKYQEQIAALKAERDLLKKHQAVCECGGLSIDHNISDNHQVSDMPPPCPFKEQIVELKAEVENERKIKEAEKKILIKEIEKNAALKAKIERLREVGKRIVGLGYSFEFLVAVLKENILSDKEWVEWAEKLQPKETTDES